MNPYQALMQSLVSQNLAATPSKPKDFKTDVDVAQNIGAQKLQKQPYNPYGLVKAPLQQMQPIDTASPPESDSAPRSRPKNFNQEMLRDVNQ